MLLDRGPLPRSNRAERAVEAEQPEVVAVRGAGERVARGVEGNDLLTALLEDRRGAVCSGAGLEAPEQVAVGGVVRLQFATVSADEDELAGGRDRACVAGVRQVALPDQPAAAGVYRGDYAGIVRPAGRDGAPELLLARLPLRLRAGNVGLGAGLGYRLLGDPVERLSGLAVEQVLPAGLAGFAESLHELPVHRGVEEDDRAGRVVVPDVVVDLLEVPAVLARCRVDRDDRAGE